MDIVAIQQAKAQGDRSYSGRPAAFVAKLARGLEPAVLSVLGDSTGNDTNEWVYLTGQWLATQYPAYTVRHYLWNDTGQNYDAPTTLHTGTASAPAATTEGFSRGDGALTSPTDGGQTYTLIGAGLTIASSKLTTSTTGAMMLLPCARRDFVLTAVVTLGNTGGFMRIPVRAADNTNYAYVEISQNSIALFRRQGNIVTQIGTSVAATVGTGAQSISVTVTGNTISATVAGATVTGTLSPADQATLGSPTSFGFLFAGTITGMAVDTIVCTPAAALYLDIYNASTPGMAAAYSQTRIPAQMPLAPDLTIINYGHNETYQSVRVPTYSLIRAVLDFHPRTQILLTAQNPRMTTAPKYVDGNVRNHGLTSFASAEGYGLIDVYSRFLANPTYGTDWIDNTDGLGLHPNSAGQLIWAGEVQKWLQPTRMIPAPSQRPSRLWLPASRFQIVEGAPVVGQISNAAGWSFDPSTEQAVACVEDIPSHWLAFNLYVTFATPINSGLSGSTNTVTWEATVNALGADPTATTVTAGTAYTTPATSTVFTVNQGVNNNSAPTIYRTTLASGLSMPTRPVAIQIRRRAADAADTYALAATLLGVVIERAA